MFVVQKKMLREMICHNNSLTAHCIIVCHYIHCVFFFFACLTVRWVEANVFKCAFLWQKMLFAAELPNTIPAYCFYVCPSALFLLCFSLAQRERETHTECPPIKFKTWWIIHTFTYFETHIFFATEAAFLGWLHLPLGCIVAKISRKHKACILKR